MSYLAVTDGALNVDVRFVTEIVVPLVLAPLRTRALWWNRKSELSQLGLLLLQTLLAPFNATILEPNLYLKKKLRHGLDT